MKANSAAAALFAGCALLRSRRLDHPIYAFFVLLIGALTLIEYLWNANLGIDELMVRDNSDYTFFAGRMSQYTSFGYVLLGLSLLSMTSSRLLLRELSRGIGFLVGLLGALSLVSHLYDRHLLGSISPQANISVPTSLAFLIGAVSVHYANPNEGIVRLLHAKNAGGTALRRLLPAAIVLSVLLGFGVRNAQKDYRWDMGFALAVLAGGMAVCLMSILVMTATSLEREELAHRESEVRFRLAANTAPVMIWMTDLKQAYVYVNEPWLRFTGSTLESQLGDGWLDMLHPDDRDPTMSEFVRCSNDLEPFQVQYRLKRFDGEYRWVLDTGVARFSEGTYAGYVGSCVDCTDRKAAEEALATLERKIIQAQEDERSRVARELHDDINQRIAVLTWEMRAFADKVKRNPKLRCLIDSAALQLRNLGMDIQAISHRLHSSHLEYLGLASAARALCEDVRIQQQADIEFSCSEAFPKLNKDISLSLYRVLQEALQNAMKHSGASKIRVELVCNESEVRLSVIDEGTGFDPRRADKQQGLGLISMRERLRLVQGDFAIQSEPGRGTEVKCRVAFASQPNKEIVDEDLQQV
jgi:PAS domain S-box-containing protein